MTEARTLTDTRRILFYFGPMTLLIFLAAPESLLDVPTSYMLKNHLHATAPQVSLFRLLTGIPRANSPTGSGPLRSRSRSVRRVTSPTASSCRAW